MEFNPIITNELIGKYFRLENGVIGVYNGKCDGECNHFIVGNEYYYRNELGDFKVADTPQELVQVGDLCYYIYCGQNVSRFIKDESDINHMVSENITAIYTPNKYKTQYTEQWRVK